MLIAGPTHTADTLRTEKSTAKKAAELEFVPTNLMVHSFHTSLTFSEKAAAPESASSDLGLPQALLPTQNPEPPLMWLISAGATSAHAISFKSGGLRKLRNEVAFARRQLDAVLEGGLPDGNTEADTARQRTYEQLALGIEVLDINIERRTDVVISQGISVVVASFFAALDSVVSGSSRPGQEQLHYEHQFLSALERIGYLVQLESLLSTRGSELHMLEDVAGTVRALNAARLELLCTRHEGDNSCLGVSEARAENGATRLVIRLGLRADCYDALPRRIRRRIGDGAEHVLVGVTTVLFTQGVNEQQSMANKIGSSDVRLQDAINRENLQTMGLFRERLEATRGDAGPWQHDEPNWDDLQALEENLQAQVATGANLGEKHVGILLSAESLVRGLGGGRMTHCKSGKDRTGMSITLEETRALEDFLSEQKYQLAQPKAQVIGTLRSYGVRRENVRLNTGQDRYAFNQVQLKFLPADYRPPANAYGSSIS